MKLGEYFDSLIISIGDLWKKETVKKTDIGVQIEEYINDHLMVPDNIVFEILSKYLKNIDKHKTIFIEGFPKTKFQAKYMIKENYFNKIIFQNACWYNRIISANLNSQ